MKRQFENPKVRVSNDGRLAIGCAFGIALLVVGAIAIATLAGL